MRRKRIKHCVLLLVLAGILILFSAGTGSKSIVSSAISQRTDTMNDYYSGKMSYKEACGKLAKIETGGILEEDIKALKSFWGTDIEEIVDYKIDEIEINYEDDDVICAFVSIKWKINGGDGLYRGSEVQNIVGSYSVILENKENIFKLVQFC